MTRVGLIVNPIAGIGGRMALKGSDDRALVEQALADGAKAVSPGRARDALSVIAAARDPVELFTYPREMGEQEARAAGIDPVVLGSLGTTTTSADTRSAAR